MQHSPNGLSRSVSLLALALTSLGSLWGCEENVDPRPDRVVPRDGTVSMDATVNPIDGSPPTDIGSCANTVCNGVCCRSGEVCRYNTCVPDLGRCMPRAADAGVPDGGAPEDTCPSDSYCDPMGNCVPYGVPMDHPVDPTCQTRAIPAPLVPATQCAWTMADIIGTPVVARLGVPPPDSAWIPSIIVAVSPANHLYIFNSQTCAIEHRLDGADQTIAPTGTPAVGDLNNDGVPEIVAGTSAGMVAFTFSPMTRTWSTLWRSNGINAYSPEPVIADVTGDARPEIISGMQMWDAMGRSLVTTPSAVSYVGYQQPTFVADVNLDGEPELIANGAIWNYNAAMMRWDRAAFDMGTAAGGFDAIADMGNFPGRAGDMPGRPEIISYNASRLLVRTIGGDTVFTVNSGAIEGGGPPAVADLDGDGLPEIVVAGRAMAAFDPDCQMMGPRPGGRCASGTTNGILWLQNRLQDQSSAINGVTVFDFDGDGRSEVVEGDECFVRIFDGITGVARWSAARPSATYIEMPIVADVDGDFSAEIVVGANGPGPVACGMARGAPDPLLRGFACSSDAACPMGTRCAGGLCRCMNAMECGENNTCTPPLMADGMGNVCRSTYQPSVGLKVYGDVRNRWVPSRPIWNQYSYSITHVTDNAGIPARAMLRNNWQVPGLNNFRQNTQGGLGDGTAPNLTIAPAPGGCLPMAGMGVRLSARFCNRGTGVAGANSSVTFFSVTRDGRRTMLCTANAARPIEPGTCADVRCDMPVMIEADATIEAQADANEQVQECRENDNRRVIYSPMDCIG